MRNYKFLIVFISLCFFLQKIHCQINTNYKFSQYLSEKNKINKLLSLKLLLFPSLIDKELKKLDSITINQITDWDLYFIAKTASRGHKYNTAYAYISKIRGGNFDSKDTFQHDIFIQHITNEKTFIKFKKNNEFLYKKALDSLKEKVSKIKENPYFDSVFICFYYDQLYRTKVNLELKNKVKDFEKIRVIDSLMRITDNYNELYIYNLCLKYGYLGWDKVGSILDVMVMHHGKYWAYYLEKMRVAALASNADWGWFNMLQKRVFLIKSKSTFPVFKFEEFYFSPNSSNSNIVMVDIFNFLKQVCEKRKIVLVLNVENINSSLNAARFLSLQKAFKNEIRKKQLEVIINSNYDFSKEFIDNVITVQLKK